MIGWLVGFNVGLELRIGLLGIIQEDDPETCPHNFDTPIWYPQRYNLDGNLEDITTTTDFTDYHDGPELSAHPTRRLWAIHQEY